MAVKFYQAQNQVPLEMHKVRMVQKQIGRAHV